MSIFATELPLAKTISKQDFVAATIAWIRGISRSRVLEDISAQELYDDEVWLESEQGETLSIKSLLLKDSEVFGARLELPDPFGRRWRTEFVVTQGTRSSGLRVRGQCVAADPNAIVETPKKPHIIRQVIEDNWIGIDGEITVSSDPIFVSENEVNTAAKSISGGTSILLPTLYVSRGNNDELPLDVDYIAKKLSGICHVFVEPSRGFSFELMEATTRKNPYGGAVGIFSSDGMQVIRALRRSNDLDGEALAEFCERSAVKYVSGLAARNCWEWQDLQE
ncbi:MAG: hypothetical protein AAGM21_13625 [Pseudomonadota bacterium]